MKCGIYKIQNKENGLVYIGKSIHIEQRFKEHIRNAYFRIDKAIAEFGEENFSFEIIEECLPEELNEKEIYWIKYYNSYEGEGYNDTPGGETNEAALIKTRKPVEQYSLDGQLLHRYISAAEASRQTKIQASNIQYCCNSHPRYKHAGGFQWKYEGSLKQIKPIQTNVHSTKKKDIIQLDKNNNIIGTYPSAMEAERQTKVNHRHISECCKSQRKTAGGYYWAYAD